MYPRLSEYPHIGSYNALLLLAYVLAFILARSRAKRAGLETRHVDNLGLMLLLVGIAGSRLFSRMFEMPNVHGLNVLKLWEGGGLVFYGGLICAATVAIVYVLANRLPFLKFLDAFAPPVLVGLSIGRVGCFLAGCCWGDVCLDRAFVESKVTEQSRLFQVQTLPSISKPDFFMAVQFPANAAPTKSHKRLGLIPDSATASAPVHPSQLYEAALAAIFALLVHLKTKSNIGSGQAGILLCASYAMIRFAVEFVRADTQPIYWGMSLSQVISLAMIGAAIALIVWRKPHVGQEMTNSPAPSPAPGAS